MQENAKNRKNKAPKGDKKSKVMKFCAIREDVENRPRNLCNLHMTIG
jgi:hypothetical protein